MIIIWELIVQIAGVLASAVLAISYLPQIWNLYKTKSTEGISLSFWYILDLSLLMLFILAVDSYMKTGEMGLIIAQGLNLVLAAIVTGQVIYYKRKEKEV